MARLKFHFYNELPGEDKFAPMPWPTEVDFEHSVIQLQDLAQRLPLAATGDLPSQLNLNKNSIPFGIGTGGYTGEAWLTLDRITSNWALLYWERSYAGAPPQFASKSLSDSCSLYLAALRSWDGTSGLMAVNTDDPDNRRLIYDHACNAELSPSGFSYTYNAYGFFKAIQKQLRVKDLFETAISKTDELVGPHVKLTHENGLLCIRHKLLPNACWFSTPHEAISAFVLGNTGQFTYRPDKNSVLAETI